MMMSTQEKIKVFSLGGVGEVGKNMYVLEVGDNIYVVDSGVMIPEDSMLGIDMVIPDISYLEDHKEKVKAIFLTHGHEDHIGGLGYVLRKIQAPVYGTKLTIALAKEVVKQSGTSLGSIKFMEVNQDSHLSFKNIEVSFFRTNHSIPDSVGICFHTSQGAIVHTGDFKFDQSQVRHASDLGTIANIGNKGVLCLLCDSTNAEKPGNNISESIVKQEIADVLYNTKSRVFVACLATNIQRIQQVVESTVLTNRKLVILNHPSSKMLDIAIDLGYLDIPEEVIVPIQQINKMNDDEIVVLTVGTHTQMLMSLQKMARGTHKYVEIKENDTVMLAASPIPGTELTVSKVVDQLGRVGATIIGKHKKIHVSGHAYQEELKLMLNLIKPKYLLPIQGEFKMQIALSKLAETTGIQDDDIFLVDKGDVIEFSNGLAKFGPKIYAGNVLIDGLGVGDVGNIVLRDRRLLSQDGILIVVVTISKAQKAIVAGPEIISRGFVYVRESEQLIEKANEIVTDIVGKSVTEKVIEWSSMKLSIRESLNQYFYEKTKRRPMILPIIMEV